MDEKNRQMNVQAEMPASVQVLGDDELAACWGGAGVDDDGTAKSPGH